ncbi:Uncharacterized protein OBRU01_02110, partial [Operophtera brumata]
MKDKYKEPLRHVHNLETKLSTVESKKVSRDTVRTSYDKPTPLDFNAFVPWVCRQWNLSGTVTVTREVQEKYIKQDHRRSSARSKTSKCSKFNIETTEAKKSIVPELNTKPNFSSDSNTVPVKAYYDAKGYLVEISITGCPLNIDKKVIHAFRICLPFHSLLTKLTIRRGGLSALLLHEIGKMLPHSNLTDVCLDDCNVPEGNYEMLLEETSGLKYLSLNRCRLGDSVCKKLADKIDFGSPGSSLLVLELGSNLISDIGARALGESLRRNRRLLHLNLSGNNITDAGATAMLCHLMEFNLTSGEIVDARQRKFKYLRNKMEVYSSCYEEVLKQNEAEIQSGSCSIKRSCITKSIMCKKSEILKTETDNPLIQKKTSLEVAEMMTMEILGKFLDPYDEYSVVKKDGYPHSKGNMVLCSMNLAYNNLSFISIKKIYDVLKYQDRLAKPSGATGLLRVVLDGNNIPRHCKEYDVIEMLLNQKVTDNIPVGTVTPKKRNCGSRSLNGINTINKKTTKKPTPISTKNKAKKDKTNSEFMNAGTDMTTNDLGVITDPFEPSSIRYVDGVYHCVGNMVLCYLNLCYNHLSYLSLKELQAGLLYQSVSKKPNQTGLMKVLVQGNNLPSACSEIERIKQLLQRNVVNFSPKASIQQNARGRAL